jgi:hypothetical protein
MGSKVRFRAWMVSIGVAALGAQTMQALGWLDLGDSIYLGTSFRLLSYLVGGFLFGIGMTLGAGCGQRILVRVGGGNLKSLLVLIIMAIIAYATLRGLLAMVRVEVFDAVAIDLAARDIPDQGIGTLLAHLTGTNALMVSRALALVLGLGTLWYAFKDSDFCASPDNILAGITIGVLVAGAWYVTGVIGNDDFEPTPLESLTFISPVGNTLNYFMIWTGSTINFGIAVVLGMIVGSFVYAIVTGNFRIETFTTRADMLNHLYAGTLMGFGGVLALGCTIGQGVSGMSTLALGSLVTLAAIVFGSALTIKVEYYMLDDPFLPSLRQALTDLHLLPRGEN